MTKYNLPVNKNQIVTQTGVSPGSESTSHQNVSIGGGIVQKTFESFVKTR